MWNILDFYRVPSSRSNPVALVVQSGGVRNGNRANTVKPGRQPSHSPRTYADNLKKLLDAGISVADPVFE